MTNQPNDPKPPDQGPRYGPYFKEDGTPAYLDLTQALAFDLVAQLSGGLLKLTLFIYTVTTQWGRDKGAPKPISYAEFGHYLNLNPRYIRAGLKEGRERCVIGVVPGAGTRPASYWVRPVADWLALTQVKHKRLHIRSASTYTSEAEHFTSDSAVISSNHLDKPLKHSPITSRSTEEELGANVTDDGRTAGTDAEDHPITVPDEEPTAGRTDKSPAPSSPEIVTPAEREPEEVLMSGQNGAVLLRNLRIEQAAKRAGQLASFTRGDHVRHPLHGAGVVVSLYGGKAIVRFVGDQLPIDPAELKLIA